MEDLKGNPDMPNKSSIIKPVTTNVVAKKDSEAKRLGKRFFSEDAKTVASHVTESVLIPSIQKLISDIVKSGIDWLIYGSKGSAQRTTFGNISYGSYYGRNGIVNPSPSLGNPMLATQKPTLYAVNEYVIADRGDAEEILLRMKEAISMYGMVSVRDFYDSVGVKANFTDQKWGWFNLDSAYVDRVDDGYSIRFPKVQPIEK